MKDNIFSNIQNLEKCSSLKGIQSKIRLYPSSKGACLLLEVAAISYLFYQSECLTQSKTNVCMQWYVS